MAANSSGKDWRGGKKARPQAEWSAKAAARAPQSNVAAWTTDPKAAYHEELARFRWKRNLWSALLVALVVVFVAWLIFRPKRTPFIAVLGTNYSAPLPPNAGTPEDVERIKSLAGESGGFWRETRVLKYTEMEPWQSKTLSLADLQKRVAETEPGGPRRNAVVLYISMHGVVNGDNEPCLVPPGVSPLDPKEWLPVQELLDGLFKAPRPNVKYLLIFDCTRMDCNWNMGLLYNGFAEGVAAVVKKMALPNLYVLTSSGPGQVAWASPELKGSVFGYFLWQGLHGAADAKPNGNADDKVSVRELHRYLEAHVGQWTRENRDDEQTPMLLFEGKDGDFPVVAARSTKSDPLPSPAEKGPRWEQGWEQVAAFWGKHEKLLHGTEPPYRWCPLQWEDFQTKLLRLERVVEAGKAGDGEYEKLVADLDKLADLLRGPADPTTAYSLPLLRQWTGHPTREEIRLASAHWQRFLKLAEEAAADAKPSEKAADKPAEVPGNPADKSKPEESKPGSGASPAKTPQTAAPKPAPEPEGPRRYLAAAHFAGAEFLKSPSLKDLPQLLQFVRGAERPDRNKPDVIEMHFLAMLEKHLDEMVGKQPDGLRQVGRAVEVRALAERVAAPTARNIHLDAASGAPAGVPTTVSAAAAPSIHHWVRKLVDQADQHRRMAEDRLFVGSKEELDKAEGDWKKSEELYADAEKRAASVARALAVRDRACMETPYLAQWLLSRLRPEKTAVPDPLAKDLRTLIKDTGRLSARLDAALEKGEWPKEPEPLVAAVENGLKKLNDAFGSECPDPQSTSGKGNAPQLRRIACCMSVPLLTGTRRNELRNDYLDIAQTIAGAFTVRAKPRESDRSKHLERLGHWEEHPAKQLVRLAWPGSEGPEGKGGDGGEDATVRSEQRNADETLLKRFAKQGETVRQRLDAVFGDPDKPENASVWMAEASKRLLTKSPAQSPAAVRPGYSQADRLARTVAALWSGAERKSEKAEPAQQLRNLDLRYLLLWHAERTLEDFWGPLLADGRPYFEAVAQEYLAAANRVREGASDLGERKDRLAKAAREAVHPVEPKALAMDSDPQSSARHAFAVGVADGLPPGEAAVYVSTGRDGDAGGTLQVQGGEKMDQPLRRAAFRTVKAGNPADKAGPLDEFRYQVKNSEVLKETEKLWATGLFRGHLVEAPFPLLFGEGVPVAWQRREMPPPTVVVKGDDKRKTGVMFILDCSWSMDEKVELADKSKVRRMKIATDALKRILARLVDKPYSVGLWAYGHRVGWTDWDAKAIVRRPRPGQPPQALAKVVPSNDVELLLFRPQFVKGELKDFDEELDTLNTLGETPLYLAIIEAIKDLRARKELGEKRIVVITDGVNDQSGLDPEGCARGTRLVHEAKDVKDEFDRDKGDSAEVRLDIVGLQLVPQNAGEREKLAQLSSLALDKGKGKYYPAGELTGLYEALEKSLAFAQYRVEAAGGEASPVTPTELDLNQVCKLKPPAGGPAVYSVRMADDRLRAKAAVTVEGGEALELFWELRPEAGRPELVHHRYRIEPRAERDHLQNPARQGEEFFVCAHLPSRDGTFPISIQNSKAERFSPRPKEVWIEIRPRLPAGHNDEGRVYCFYDPDFQPATPVPVVRCQALQWPEAAEEATIEAWFRFDAAKGEQRRAGDPLNNFRLPEAPEISFEGPEIKVDSRRATTVTLTEIHTRGRERKPLKVEMQPPPDKVEHRYNSKTGMVRHQFTYGDRHDVKDVREYMVRFVTRESLAEKAVHLPPLPLTMPRDL